MITIVRCVNMCRINQLEQLLGVKQVWHNDTSKWIAWIHNCWTLGLRSLETRHWIASGNQNHNVNPRLKNLVEGFGIVTNWFCQLACYHENPWKSQYVTGIPETTPQHFGTREHIPIIHVWSKVGQSCLCVTRSGEGVLARKLPSMEIWKKHVNLVHPRCLILKIGRGSQKQAKGSSSFAIIYQRPKC